MEVFRQTSDVPYDRHNYEIVLKTGKTVFFDDWTDAQGYWFVHNQILVMGHKVQTEHLV